VTATYESSAALYRLFAICYETTTDDYQTNNINRVVAAHQVLVDQRMTEWRLPYQVHDAILPVNNQNPGYWMAGIPNQVMLYEN
jgi:hypothetical protein